MKFTIVIASIFAISQAGDCSIDESLNWLGPHRCLDDSECAGDRTCGFFGSCKGTSNCVEGILVDPIEELHLELDALEQEIEDRNRENSEMREAFRKVTEILSEEFLN